MLAADRAYAEAVRGDEAEAARSGATGVPFFVVDRKYGVAGAQPVEVFSDVLRRAWGGREPALTVVDVDDRAGCDAEESATRRPALREARRLPTPNGAVR